MAEAFKFTFSHYAATMTSMIGPVVLHRGRGKGGSFMFVPVTEMDAIDGFTFSDVGYNETELVVPLSSINPRTRKKIDFDEVCEENRFHVVPDYDVTWERWVLRLKEVRRAQNGLFLKEGSDVIVEVI